MVQGRDLGDTRPREEDPEARREELEAQIAGLRDELGDLITEMERRGRRAMDLRRQATRHPAVLSGAAGLVLTAAGVWFYLAWQQRSVPRYRRARRTERFRLALAHLVSPSGARAFQTGTQRVVLVRRRGLWVRRLATLTAGAALYALYRRRRTGREVHVEERLGVPEPVPVSRVAGPAQVPGPGL